VLELITSFCIFSLLLFVVSTSAIDCLERLVFEMTYYVSSGTLNYTHSLTLEIIYRMYVMWQFGWKWCFVLCLLQELSHSLQRPMRIVGWYHSHPHITVWPSHLGICLSLNYWSVSNFF